MTKVEKIKLEKLMQRAIYLAKLSSREYEKAEQYLRDQKPVEWEVAQRGADQYYGWASGLEQALTVLNFKHEHMKTLQDLL